MFDVHFIEGFRDSRTQQTLGLSLLEAPILTSISGLDNYLLGRLDKSSAQPRAAEESSFI